MYYIIPIFGGSRVSDLCKEVLTASLQTTLIIISMLVNYFVKLSNKQESESEMSIFHQYALPAKKIVLRECFRSAVENVEKTAQSSCRVSQVRYDVRNAVVRHCVQRPFGSRRADGLRIVVELHVNATVGHEMIQ